MDWEIDAKSKKRLSDIAEAVKRADRVILATDPDREGEAISWHVLQVLRDKRVLRDKPVERVVFNAVTKQAVQDAMRQPRAIDEPLVEAYLARRALDYLVGFTLSPVLWRKLRGPDLPGASSRWRCGSSAIARVRSSASAAGYWSVVANAHAAKREFAPACRLTAQARPPLDRQRRRTRAASAAWRLGFTSLRSRPSHRSAIRSRPFTTSDAAT
jgi:DNA topoisomerase-1